jgi:hypothetical protein
MTSDAIAKLFNRQVLKGMHQAIKNNSILNIDEQNRRMMLYSDKYANKLNNIFFDPVLTKQEKTNRVIQQLMQPNHMDLMVTGVFMDNATNGTLSIRPMVIYRYSRKIQSRNLQFDPQELMCKDKNNGITSLCPKAAKKITDAVKELLEQG